MVVSNRAAFQGLADLVTAEYRVQAYVDAEAGCLGFDAGNAENASRIRHAVNAKAAEMGLPKTVAFVGTPVHECNKIISQGHDDVPNHFVFFDGDKLTSKGIDSAVVLLQQLKADTLSIMGKAKNDSRDFSRDAQERKGGGGPEPTR